MDYINDRGYLHRVLVETDRLYFALGARRSSSSGLDLLYLPGYIGSPSASAVWGVNRLCTEDQFSRMLSTAESELRDLGGATMRVYVEDPVPAPIANAFSQRGYLRRVEVALLTELPSLLETPPPEDSYHFMRVQTQEQWRLKELLHAADNQQSDGYSVNAKDWVGLERVKCDSGGMSCYLMMQRQQPVAAVGLILDRGVARLKNLYVGAAFRRRGIGLSTIRFLAVEASELGYDWFGCFAVETGNAIRVYQRAGLDVVASVSEFSRHL